MLDRDDETWSGLTCFGVCFALLATLIGPTIGDRQMDLELGLGAEYNLPRWKPMPRYFCFFSGDVALHVPGQRSGAVSCPSPEWLYPHCWPLVVFSIGRTQGIRSYLGRTQGIRYQVVPYKVSW